MNMTPLRKSLCIIGVAAAVVGCGQPEKLGGGSRSFVIGTTPVSAVYGIRAGKELGFLILTDLASEGTRSTAGSSWTGQIEPSAGPVIQYAGDADGLAINGTRYKFANGRVFVVTTVVGPVAVQQLNIPIGNAPYDAEIDAIVKQPEIEQFLIP